MEISAKYSNFLNIFFLDFLAELLKYTRINNHFINLLDIKQLFYSIISNSKLLELEMLKNYIRINLANSFIKSSKFHTSAQI